MFFILSHLTLIHRLLTPSPMLKPSVEIDFPKGNTFSSNFPSILLSNLKRTAEIRRMSRSSVDNQTTVWLLWMRCCCCLWKKFVCSRKMCDELEAFRWLSRELDAEERLKLSLMWMMSNHTWQPRYIRSGRTHSHILLNNWTRWLLSFASHRIISHSPYDTFCVKHIQTRSHLWVVSRPHRQMTSKHFSANCDNY